MAQKTTVTLVDDLDGTEAGYTVEFSFDGTAYEIDLTQEHYDEMYDALEPYLNAGRRVAKAKARRATSSGSKSPSGNAAVIRAWAVENGMEVPTRGRIPREIVEAYEKARA